MAAVSPRSLAQRRKGRISWRCGLPDSQSCARLAQDAVRAGLTSECDNGGAEGVNTKTKLIKRQMYGRAGFPLLLRCILLGWPHSP